MCPNSWAMIPLHVSKQLSLSGKSQVQNRWETHLMHKTHLGIFYGKTTTKKDLDLHPWWPQDWCVLSMITQNTVNWTINFASQPVQTSCSFDISCNVKHVFGTSFHPRKLTWQWNITSFNRRYTFRQMVVFSSVMLVFECVIIIM